MTMLYICERRRRPARIIRSSAQWIVLGMCVLSTCDKIVLRGCQAFSFPRKILAGNSFSYRLRREKLWDCDRDSTTKLSLCEENKEENDDDQGPSPGLPALLPAGTSSSINDNADSVEELLDTAAAATATINDETTNSVATFVNPKFALQYTCNICETKNRVVVSRQAYREGMVIAVCKGCGNKHWIADNLDPTLSHRNIEEYLESMGQGDTVNRVTEEVYEIERVWGLKEGEITDESGDTVLE